MEKGKSKLVRGEEFNAEGTESGHNEPGRAGQEDNWRRIFVETL